MRASARPEGFCACGSIIGLNRFFTGRCGPFFGWSIYSLSFKLGFEERETRQGGQPATLFFVWKGLGRLQTSRLVTTAAEVLETFGFNYSDKFSDIVVTVLIISLLRVHTEVFIFFQYRQAILPLLRVVKDREGGLPIPARRERK